MMTTLKKIPFVKMQGAGNDYVYLNGFETEIQNPSALARAISDRHFGVGSDGLILVLPPAANEAHCRMRMFNTDGSESEMCGNGVRCVAKFAHDRGIARVNPIVVETGAGLLSILMTLGLDGKATHARVNMGAPILKAAQIPAAFSGERVVNHPLEVEGQTHRVTCVSMGNPHCVIFVDDVEAFPVEAVGRRIETHPAFPNRTNVEFVQRLPDGTLRQRTWERGAGETLACGTGACAVLVSAVLNTLSPRTNTIRLSGGDLTIEWSESNEIFMTGDAVDVFEGVYFSSIL